MTAGPTNRQAFRVVPGLIAVIAANRQRLSDIDGLIGDGDHGVNMHKAFQQCAAALRPDEMDLTAGLRCLGQTLLNLGGSMGPLYGLMFGAMSKATEGVAHIDSAAVGAMLAAAEERIMAIGGCQLGDKTLLDVLHPARRSFEEARDRGEALESCLLALKHGAEGGRKATEAMIARKGRASRLGERSRGVPDPGATSCSLLLSRMADELLAGKHAIPS